MDTAVITPDRRGLGKSILKAFIAAMLAGFAVFIWFESDPEGAVNPALMLPITGIMGCTAGVLVFLYAREADERWARGRVRLSEAVLPWERVVCALEERIDDLSRAAKLMYWTILAVIISGVMLVIYAGDLASLDSKTRAINESLDQELNSVTLQSLRDQANVFRDELDRLRRGPSGFGPQERVTLEMLNQRAAQEGQIVKEIQERRRALFEVSLANMKNNSGSNGEINLSGMVLRACIIGLLIFLVQILVQLYRYNSRLVAFYGSRRDALLISEGEPEKLKLVMPVMAPTGFDFGRQPTHPLQEIAGLVGSSAEGAVRRRKTAAQQPS